MDSQGSSPDIRFQPSDGFCLNPNQELYWDTAALGKELVRSFELCHSCRMCFKYCQSFPTLFAAVDRYGGVANLPAATVDQVVDECFQCKLCYTQCPYTDKETHPFRLDVPRLMLRAKAVNRKRTGIPLRDRMLADPDLLGRVGTVLPALANWGNTLRPQRVVMEALGGIHRDKLLPRFAGRTFDAWFAARAGGEETPDGENPVVLFATCFVNYNNPALGEAAFEVLRHNGCRIACPNVECCGMPALDSGDIGLARRKARTNVRALLPWVERGYRIAVINPTCSLMMREEYPELLDDPADRPLAEAAQTVAGAVRDLSEYLFELRAEGKFKEDFKSTPGGNVACHAPCHLRKQNVGFRGRDLIRRIPGAKPKLVAECCGHDGTWAMKKENFAAAMGNGEKAFAGMREAEAEVWSTDCPLAALQFEQACGKKPLHPVEVLARAYRPDGFRQRIVSTEEDATVRPAKEREP
jgi:glycerol-3-phosphate dehydrogenase subunit C